MKHLKSFNESLDNFPTDPKVIRDFCRIFKIKDYRINDDGTVDIFRDCFIARGDISFSKLPIKFGHVEGSFTLANKRLTTLEGCPHTVTEDFYCSGTLIKNLEGIVGSLLHSKEFQVKFVEVLDLISVLFFGMLDP